MRRGSGALRACSLVLLMTACPGSDVPEATGQPPNATSQLTPRSLREARDLWRSKGSSSYSFRLRSFCGERGGIGTFAVTVRDGVVRAVEPLDDRTVPPDRNEIPTIDGLFAIADRARRDGADRVATRFDQNDGHPIAIDIDHRLQVVDDEACYRVSRLRPV